jgi:hypothetical protein
MPLGICIFNLDISLDRTGSKLDLDVMVDTSVMVEGRSRSVPKVWPTCFGLSLTPRIKSIIRLKNSQRHRAQRARLTGNRRARDRAAALYNMLNRLVQCLTSESINNSFQNKIGTLRPGHKSLWNFTKRIKNGTRWVPALKVDEKPLITDADKANAIASKFAEAHNNTMISPLSNMVRCLTHLQIKGVVKNWETARLLVAMLLITSCWRTFLAKLLYIWSPCLMVVWNYRIFRPNGSTQMSFPFQSPTKISQTLRTSVLLVSLVRSTNFLREKVWDDSTNF